MLIKIFCTIPVLTTTPERSFSNLKRIKTYLRNSMNEVNLQILNYDILLKNENIYKIVYFIVTID